MSILAVITVLIIMNLFDREINVPFGLKREFVPEIQYFLELTSFFFAFLLISSSSLEEMFLV